MSKEDNKVLIFRCPCGSVIMKSAFPIYDNDPDCDKEIIELLKSGYIPSVEAQDDSNRFSPHVENCVNKNEMKTYTLEQYQQMAVKFNNLSFIEKIKTIQKNSDILTLAS